MLSLEELRAARKERRLTKEEKEAYRDYWQSSKENQRSFCKQEGLPLPIFNGWLKLLSCKPVKEDKISFIAAEVSTKSAKQALSLALQFKLPNGGMVGLKSTQTGSKIKFAPTLFYYSLTSLTKTFYKPLRINNFTR